MKSKQIIISFGKPGAGKGTRISEFLLGREYTYTTFSVGNALRKAREENSELGKKAAEYMDSGKLVPDEIINAIIIKAILNEPKNLILDGFPRTVGQAKAMLEAGIHPDLVVQFYVDDQVVIQRAKDRIVCGKCGEPYTTNDFKRPKQDGVCDFCGDALVRRPDDEGDVVKQRLLVYTAETAPVLEVLKDAGIPVVTILNNGKEAQKEFERVLLEL